MMVYVPIVGMNMTSMTERKGVSNMKDTTVGGIAFVAIIFMPAWLGISLVLLIRCLFG